MVIAEIGQNHDGSLGQGYAYVDAVAKAGADGVKFQWHVAEEESARDEPWRVQFSRQDASRYEYWKRMEWTLEQWAGLAEHARRLGLRFGVSPFSVRAVELADPLVDFWKVASGELTDYPVLRAIKKRAKRPVFLSTGMSGMEEIHGALRVLSGCEVTVLQCTSKYPCPPEEAGLNLIRKYPFEGLSDHTGSVFTGLAAAVLGARVLEVHVTFHRGCFGPDISSSITLEELATLVAGVRWIERLGQRVDKDVMAGELAPMRQIFMKGLVLRQDVAAGEVLLPEHLGSKKPLLGVPADDLELLLGRRLRRDVAAGERLSLEMVEEHA